MIMAGTKNGIAERKLRPVWDAIDSRQYKSALKLVTVLLAKHPGSAYLLALKALVLERIGKGDEALVVCQQAKDSAPVDELTLSTLQMVYQRLDRLDQITLCYEYAVSKSPQNFDFLTCLFNCYVREYIYIKQQQVAMKLYRMMGEEKYLLWAVCSIQLQVHCGNGNGTQLLPLAEALIKKHLQTHELRNLESLLVYLTVLREQRKFDAALETLSAKLGDLFSIPADKLRLQGNLLMESCQYDRAADVFKEVLKLSSDDWDDFLCLLAATLEEPRVGATSESRALMCNGETPTALKPEEVERRLNTVDSFVEELLAMEVDYLRRGPYLAKLEIAKRRLLFKQIFSDEEGIVAGERDLINNFVQYFERFGHMVSFASDVRGFIPYVGESEKERLASTLERMCANMVGIDAVKLLRWRVGAYQVEELLAVKAKLPNLDLVGHAVGITQLYVDNLHLSAVLDPKESMYGEELLVLAVNMLVELFRRTQEVAYIIEAILVLEFGLSMRKYSSQYKIMVTNLYCLLSAGSSAVQWYKTLDIKYILLDTLSHHILYYLLGSPLWSDLEVVLKDSIKFHKDHEADAGDLTIHAYRHGTYSKVLEFVQFKEKLQQSHHHVVVRIEDSILTLKKENTVAGVVDRLAQLDLGRKTYRLASETQLAALTFLEDLQTRPWWSPAPDECYLADPSLLGQHISWHYEDSEAKRMKREERWKVDLRKRGILPRLLYLSLNAVSPKQERDSTESNRVPEDLGLLLEEYSGILGVAWENVDDWLSDRVKAKTLVKGSGIGAVDVLSFGVFSIAQKLSSQIAQADGPDNGLEKSFDTLMRAIGCTLQVVLESMTAMPNTAAHGLPTEVLAPGPAVAVLMSLTSEVLSWLGLCLQSWRKHVQPTVRRKKKGGVASIHSSEEISDRKLSSISQVLQKAQTSLSCELKTLSQWLTKFLERSEEEEAEQLLSLLKQNNTEAAEKGPLPGSVLQVLQSSAVNGVTSAKWRPQSVVKKIISGQREVIDGIRDLAEKQLRTLNLVKV